MTLFFVGLILVLGAGVAIVACSKSRLTIYAWIVYFVGETLLLVTDYLVRRVYGRVHMGPGIPEPLGFGIAAVVLIVFLTLITKGSYAFKSGEVQAAVVIVQFATAVVLLVVITILFAGFVGEEISYNSSEPNHSMKLTDSASNIRCEFTCSAAESVAYLRR